MFDKKFLLLLIALFVVSTLFLSVRQYQLLAVHKDTAWLTAGFVEPEKKVLNSFFVTNNGEQPTEITIQIKGSSTDTENQLSTILSPYETKTFPLTVTEEETLIITITNSFGEPLTLTKK